MNPILQRILMAYRPLCLRGLLMDGQYRWPAVDVSNGIDAPRHFSDGRNHNWMSAPAQTRHP